MFLKSAKDFGTNLNSSCYSYWATLSQTFSDNWDQKTCYLCSFTPKILILMIRFLWGKLWFLIYTWLWFGFNLKEPNVDLDRHFNRLNIIELLAWLWVLDNEMVGMVMWETVGFVAYLCSLSFYSTYIQSSLFTIWI